MTKNIPGFFYATRHTRNEFKINSAIYGKLHFSLPMIIWKDRNYVRRRLYPLHQRRNSTYTFDRQIISGVI